MGRNKHGGLAAAARRSVKDRHQRAARENITVPRNLVVLPEKNIQSKHKSYFQLFENKDGREKKLEYKVFMPLVPHYVVSVLPANRLPPIQTPRQVTYSCPAVTPTLPTLAKSSHESKML